MWNRQSWILGLTGAVGALMMVGTSCRPPARPCSQRVRTALPRKPPRPRKPPLVVCSLTARGVTLDRLAHRALRHKLAQALTRVGRHSPVLRASGLRRQPLVKPLLNTDEHPICVVPRILASGHVVVLKTTAASGFKAEVRVLARLPGIARLYPVLLREALLVVGRRFATVLVEGLPTAVLRQGNTLERQLLKLGPLPLRPGQLAPVPLPGKGGPRLALGAIAARQLQLQPGDRVALVDPISAVAPPPPPAGAPLLLRTPQLNRSVKPFYAWFAGPTQTGITHYERKLVRMSLPHAQALFGKTAEATTLKLFIRDLSQLKAATKHIENTLGGHPYRVVAWDELQRPLLARLRVHYPHHPSVLVGTVERHGNACRVSLLVYDLPNLRARPAASLQTSCDSVALTRAAQTLASRL